MDFGEIVVKYREIYEEVAQAKLKSEVKADLENSNKNQRTTAYRLDLLQGDMQIDLENAVDEIQFLSIVRDTLYNANADQLGYGYNEACGGFNCMIEDFIKEVTA